MPEAAAPPQDPAAQVPPRQLLSLLALAAVVGLVVSLAAWCFLEAVHWTQVWVYDDLPDALGYDGDAPMWWPLPVCFVAAAHRRVRDRAHARDGEATCQRWA